jgi:hypothetical protein
MAFSHYLSTTSANPSSRRFVAPDAYTGLKTTRGINSSYQQHAEMPIGSGLVEHNRSKFADL